MYSEWTKHLQDPEGKVKFEQQIHSAKDVLDRQKVLLEEKLNTLDRSEVDINVYNTPNWAERQAHKNGQRSSLMYLLQLVDLSKQDIKHDR
jgi:hypothetical protein